MRHLVLAAVAAAAVALPAAASTVGQPFLVIDAAEGGTPFGSIVNVFDGGVPSRFVETTIGGTVTSAVGAPGAVGQAFRLDADSRAGGADFSLGGSVTSAFEDNPTAFIPVDPFGAGPGDLNFALALLPDFTEVGPADTVVFDGPFSIFGPRDRADANAEVVRVTVAIFLDDVLPSRDVFDPLDPDTLLTTIIEGQLSIDRIEIGTVGGEPVLPPVPLPAGLPLLLGALGALGLARRRA